MVNQTYYAAVGNFRRKSDGAGRSYPVIIVNRQEYLVDMQEMALWTCLNWRILDADQAEDYYTELERSLLPEPVRTFEACLKRLQVRGLVASGSGNTDADALYDLLSGLYVVPVSESILLRVLTFLKMLVLDGVPFPTARDLFRKAHLSAWEQQVLALARQALLSTAELVKCVEGKVSDLSTHQKVMDALYNDDFTTCDNIVWEMRQAENQELVTLSMANLYLRKQIIFERI